MRAIKYRKKLAGLLAGLLSFAVVVTMMPQGSFEAYSASGALKTEQPVLVVTGQGVLGGASYGAANVNAEKAYTLAELKALSGNKEYTFSAKKQKPPFTKSQFKAKGIDLSLLVSGLATTSDRVSIIADDGYVSTFQKGGKYNNVEDSVTGVGSIGSSLDYSRLKNIAAAPGFENKRYWYKDFDASAASEVPAVIAWNYEESTDGVPASAGTGDLNLRLLVGQLGGSGFDGPEDMNGPLYNGGSKAAVNRVLVGDALSETVLTVGSQKFTRSDILLMARAERSYTYLTKGGEKTDTAVGVPLSELLSGVDENTTISFEAADGYDMSSASKKLKDLISNNYMLAYEVNGEGVYEEGGGAYGLLTLYGDGDKPAKMINKVTPAGEGGIDYASSPYKHVTNGGIDGQDAPYNIDSITGATLTVEGPGVKTSVPLSIKDMETRSAGYFRGVYSDTRNGKAAARTYEGMDLYYLLHNMSSGDNGIVLTKDAAKVSIRNRNRQEISNFDLSEIEKAHNEGRPILIAYGTAFEDGTSPAPFVFDGAAGAVSGLGNEDGCIKLVYDTSKYDGHDPKYTKFGNMAYVYVEEAARPGYKHINAGKPYDAVQNTQAIISVTGDTLGREVNYTLEDIENMVEYDAGGNVVDNGFGVRSNYSLTNTSYWYVNEYEGVRLWSLLLNSGLDPKLSGDDKTVVNYLTTDNYSGTDKFTLAQIADDKQFGFYEKNALDLNDGNYVPNESIRVNNDPATGDKLSTGYPVLLAYGVNGYPYVISSKLDGYMSGLSNDGGPVRVISGKTAYGHNNGSSQAQKLSGIVVGSNEHHYATHKYHEDSVYKDLAGSSLSVKITTKAGKSKKTQTKTYTAGDLEELIYGGGLTATQMSEAMVKAKYRNGKYSDLYEGVSLAYFLQNVVELSGTEGSITFKGADGSSVKRSLAEMIKMKNGTNPDTGVSGLVPVIAYGKNGAPLVADKTSAGYVSSENLAAGTKFEHSVDIKNQGGPLQLIIPAVKGGKAEQSVSNIVSISISLDADKYSHAASPYSSYAKKKITISGAGTNLMAARTFKVSELESKQTLAGTYDYSIRNKKGKVSTVRYRGIRLYDLLRSSNVGLRSNADKVIITTRSGKKKTYSIAAVMKTNYINSKKKSVKNLPVLLAYGSSKTTVKNKKTGKPLVKNSKSKGYSKKYKNSGGPVKLVIGQSSKKDKNAAKCLDDVVSIEVTASGITNWNHSSSATFASYLDRKLTFEAVDTAGNVVKSSTETVGQLESMQGLIKREKLHLEVDNEWEGLDLWALLNMELKGVNGLEDPVAINVIAADGFSYNVLEQGLDALQNGVKDGSEYYPIMLAYGCDGTPLAQFGKNDTAGPGYDSKLGNGNGPIRLVVHNANGKSAGNVVKIQVKVKGGGASAASIESEPLSGQNPPR